MFARLAMVNVRSDAVFSNVSLKTTGVASLPFSEHRNKSCGLRIKAVFPCRAVRVCLFVGFIFPNFTLCLPPVLNGATVLAASLLVQFIGSLGDLRRQIGRYLGFDGIKNPIGEQFDASFTRNHSSA